ncbi:macrolide 2'-phosphotransferase [Alkalicoccobacillus murimartini]|uniref:Macrolide phosphotransferase n=1 Tax=Alkalicoccobacillus murimartini TaxID=171685 RepID=A0ABT9YKQ6_9BACI|nr:macrolide 2'-phosphotransferase [Alkalicoccobacillus murimartini]MDQ0207614.1 macrolide phosphotransferase [Alkalicoccobacillus murimartini]
MKTSEIKQLTNRNGLDILEETMRINESGVDFRVVHATDQKGDKWILRLPRRPQSMRHSLQEKRALDLLNKHADFHVPNWSVFSKDIIAYKQLQGIPVATIDIEKQNYVWSFDQTKVPSSYYDSLGKSLANLHSLPQEEFKKIGVEVLDASELRTSMKERMKRVKETYHVNENLWNRWQAWLAEDSIWPSFVGVKHGDLHPGHILMNKNNHVTGFIDWTEVGVADVSVDFMSHLLLFGKDGLMKLIDAYDNAGGRTWTRMEDHIAERLTTSGITVAEFAKVSGMEDMQNAAVHMLESDS